MRSPYVGDENALLGAERFIRADGKGKGMEIMLIHNGVLTLEVMLDRAMDIRRLDVRGENIGFLCKNGPVATPLMGTDGLPFGSCFPGGFLYTCGLDNVMSPDVIDGAELPQHGTLTYLPATNVSATTRGDVLEVTGQMRYTALFGRNLVLRRTILIKRGEASFDLRDEVINEDYADGKFLIMYHHNLGYPLLSETAKLTVDSSSCEVYAKGSNLEKRNEFVAPIPKCPEEVFMHTVNPGKKCHAKLQNGERSCSIFWDAEALPYMVQWKSMASQDYACGLEPSMSKWPSKDFITLKAGESKVFELHYEFE